jgi:hypothetical protein
VKVSISLVLAVDGVCLGCWDGQKPIGMNTPRASAPPTWNGAEFFQNASAGMITVLAHELGIHDCDLDFEPMLLVPVDVPAALFAQGFRDHFTRIGRYGLEIVGAFDAMTICNLQPRRLPKVDPVGISAEHVARMDLACTLSRLILGRGDA